MLSLLGRALAVHIIHGWFTLVLECLGVISCQYSKLLSRKICTCIEICYYLCMRASTHYAPGANESRQKGI